MSEEILEQKSGKFKTETKFLEFIGAKGNINFIANEATIEAKYLTGLGLDDVVFKLTIFEDGTVDFEEVDTNQTTSEQRFRLLKTIEEKTLTSFRSKMVVNELTFTSCKEVSGKKINLYLSVDFQKPITKLAKLTDNEKVELSEDQNKKIGLLFSLFDDEESTENEVVEQVEVEDKVEENTKEVIIDWRKTLSNSFEESKTAKIFDLETTLSKRKFDLQRNISQIETLKKNTSDIESEIELLESRLESLKPAREFNNFYFNVSENLNEKVDLEPEIENILRTKLAKVKGINVENFMKLFVVSEFEIRLSQKNEDKFEEVVDFKSIPLDIYNLFAQSKLSFSIESNVLSYKGESSWAEVVNEMLKLGFGQDPEWDKLCESNSFSEK